MDKLSLQAKARELAGKAAASKNGRAADTVYGGHEKVLRQTVIALREGAAADDPRQGVGRRRVEVGAAQDLGRLQGPARRPADQGRPGRPLAERRRQEAGRGGQEAGPQGRRPRTTGQDPRVGVAPGADLGARDGVQNRRQGKLVG